MLPAIIYDVNARVFFILITRFGMIQQPPLPRVLPLHVKASVKTPICNLFYGFLIFCLTKVIDLLYSIAHPFCGLKTKFFPEVLR